MKCVYLVLCISFELLSFITAILTKLGILKKEGAEAGIAFVDRNEKCG